MMKLLEQYNHLKALTFQSRFITNSPVLQRSTVPALAATVTFPDEKPTLTDEEITKINLLIPRLCLSNTNHLPTAIQLMTTALLTNPPLQSLSLSIFIHSLTSEPDMAKPMSVLTVLRHNPSAHAHLSPTASMLVSSYMRRKRPKEALKVYHWMLRPGSACKVGKDVYGVLVYGFCNLGLVLDSLKVLRDMVDEGLLPGNGLRRIVKRSLLWEARVCEAVELDTALSACYTEGAAGEFYTKLLNLLDSLIGNWREQEKE
ncbi:unnamed protein product [Linum tenue]|uniref:Pentatricopeptide repeat-containing protein n=1 Tax=Linum tenue TaxID=586396 RepID=A0AAV0QM84_9ROSI|nr:unnamed protein product [Linum tenue]